MTEQLAATSTPYGLFIKAESARCNLDCHYCYYLKNEDKSKPGMDAETLDKLVSNHIQSQPPQIPVIDFIWHGGEPMMKGLAFYQTAIELQQAHQSTTPIQNTIQTNGTLINERWAAFFAQHNFIVGISIDGPQLINDIARIDKAGNSSFERTMRGIQHLKQQNVEFNTLTVINNKSYKHGKAIYRFLKENGSTYLQFQPCIDHEMDRRFDYDWTLTGKQWGEFLCNVFDEWAANDIGKVYVQFFENCLMILMGHQSQMCHHAETCGQQLMIESNGDVFSCDHYAYNNYKIGNINDNNASLAQMVNSPEQMLFGQNKHDSLNQKCFRCDFKPLCNGGCPKNRVDKINNGENHNVLCKGYEHFFKHALPTMLKMVDAMKQGYSPIHYPMF
ncbi:anaerobic sulfatase maturase [Aliivibrio fischeri]|uniref:anaerobic sulfatase maturase n=1 Tax=Aliivibrio fischeri TaxID=668 RepID=UPI0007C56CDD|nr:anaerobic sulfatase maturase [Aliivibrio fischeri]MBP3139433.1 anaerobic sulfatase maturase [Aliivibrio fischeri]MBP3155023.1 anaerobic sulfatase maturase [Aliivibrio fischeri]MCE7573195.1 anaerobic sulfatase maturase [Aliivibrio fischeri]MUK43652.1 anaerobic sulfatase maturase [Aliivibrio fischeri]